MLQRYFPSHASPFQIRQAQILEEYNIICQCRLCTLPLIERERSDDSRVRRREILDNLDRDMKRNPTLALARIEEAILLAVQEGLWEGIFWDFEKACMICCGWGDEESAEMWREPAKRTATLTWGDQISKILSSTVIDVEPKENKNLGHFSHSSENGKDAAERAGSGIFESKSLDVLLCSSRSQSSWKHADFLFSSASKR